MSQLFGAGAVVYAKDVERVSRFYAEVASLRVAQEEPGYTVLESQGFQLVVVAIPARIAQQIEIASPPVRREDSAIKLCFSVPSLAQARSRVSALGGELNGAEREWQFQGSRVCDGHDPEGNVVQLRETVL